MTIPRKDNDNVVSLDSYRAGKAQRKALNGRPQVAIAA
jgi:hypothetical protein